MAENGKVTNPRDAQGAALTKGKVYNRKIKKQKAAGANTTLGKTGGGLLDKARGY